MTTTVSYAFTLSYTDKGIEKLYLQTPFGLELLATMGDAKSYRFQSPYKIQAQLAHRYVFRLPYLEQNHHSYYIFKAPYLNNSKPVPMMFDFVFEFKSVNPHHYSYEFFLPYKAAITNAIKMYGIYDTLYNTEYGFRFKSNIELDKVTSEEYKYKFEYKYVDDNEHTFHLPYKNQTPDINPYISHTITGNTIKFILDRTNMDYDFDVVIDNGNKFTKYRKSITNPLFQTSEFVDSKWTTNEIELTIKNVDIESTFSMSFLKPDGSVIYSKLQSLVIPAEPVLVDSALIDHRVVTLPGSLIRARFQLADECCLSKKVSINKEEANSACSMPDIEDRFVISDVPDEYFETFYSVNLEYGNSGFTPGTIYEANIIYEFPVLSQPSLMIFNGNDFMISTDYGLTWQIQESYDNIMRQNVAEMDEGDAILTDEDLYSSSPNDALHLTQEIYDENYS